MANYCSDNVTGAAAEVIEALTQANTGAAMPYGADHMSAAVTEKMAEIFECPVEVFFVATGTAANSLALSVLTPPYGAIYAHQDAHVQVHECGAPEFFTGGAKLLLLAGDAGKILPGELETAISGASRDVHYAQPSAMTVSQASEVGRVYSVTEIEELCGIAKAGGLRTHMDGARFANAIAATGNSPADMTWRAGVDILSFGATKNGAIAAEAVVLFDQSLGEEFAFRRKRGGHLFSKSRFFAAQFDASLTDNRWLDWAAHANQMAIRLSQGLTERLGAEIAYPVEANILFVKIAAAAADALNQAGFEFYRMGDSDPVPIRLVTAFNTDPADIDRFIEIAATAAG